MRTRSFTELSQIPTFLERYRYLRLGGYPGDKTFGFDRWINQRFYGSREWRQARQRVIARDLGCDLGITGYPIYSQPYIHHLNPMTVADIADGEDWILDPEYLITTTHSTHNAIHYGDENQLPREHIERRPGDTLLWKRRSW